MYDPADKTNNYYRIKPNQYEYLLMKELQKRIKEIQQDKSR